MLDKRLHIKISKDQYQWIKGQSSAYHKSMGEFVRGLISYSIIRSEHQSCWGCGVPTDHFIHDINCPAKRLNI